MLRKTTMLAFAAAVAAAVPAGAQAPSMTAVMNEKARTRNACCVH